MYLKALSNCNAEILQDLLDPKVRSKVHAHPFTGNAWENPTYYDDGIKVAFEVFYRIPGALETLNFISHR
jgi:hypothetical protein